MQYKITLSDRVQYPAAQSSHVSRINSPATTHFPLDPSTLQMSDLRIGSERPNTEDMQPKGGTKPKTVLMVDDLLCHASSVCATDRTLRVSCLGSDSGLSGGQFINVTGKANDIAPEEYLKPAKRQQLIDFLENPVHIPGSSILLAAPKDSTNFFHYIIEQMPRLALYSDVTDGRKVDNIVLLSEKEQPFHRDAIRTFFPDLAENVFVEAGCVYCDEAYFFFAPHLYGSPEFPVGTDGSFLRFMRRLQAWRGQNTLDRPSSENGRPKVLLISRSPKASRTLANERELRSRMKSEGFDVSVVRTEEMNLAQKAHTFYEADIIIGQHGAGMSNIVFAKPGAMVIEISGSLFIHRTRDLYKISIGNHLRHNVIFTDLDVELPEGAPGSVVRPEGRPGNDFPYRLVVNGGAMRKIVALCNEHAERISH